MKRRRTLIISLLLIASLALGIGYAALSSELLISGGGSLTAKQTDLVVVFTAAQSSDSTLGTANADNTRNATFTVSGLHEKDQTVTFTYTVTNQSKGLDVYLNTPTVSTMIVTKGTAKTPVTASDYFDVTTDITKAGNEAIAVNGTATVTVTVKLKKTLDDIVELTANVTVPTSTEAYPVNP